MNERQPKQETPEQPASPVERLDQDLAAVLEAGGYINAELARRIAQHLQTDAEHGLKRFSSKGTIDHSLVQSEISGIIATASGDEEGERNTAYALAFGQYMSALDGQSYVIFDETGPTYDSYNCCTECGSHIADPHSPECEHNHEEETQTGIDIYVASTRDLDNPVWIDATMGYDAVRGEIDYLLRATFNDDPNGWQVRASEGFGTVDVDGRSLAEIVAIAQEIEDHGEVFGLWVEHVGLNLENMDDVIREFHQRFQGKYPSLDEFAQVQLERHDDADYSIEDFQQALPDDVRPFVTFDREGYTESLRTTYVVLEGDEYVYIFSA